MKGERDELEVRLKSAEKENLNHNNDAKDSIAKLYDRVNNLKERNEKLSDKVSELNSEISRRDKRAKSIEKVNRLKEGSVG